MHTWSGFEGAEEDAVVEGLWRLLEKAVPVLHATEDFDRLQEALAEPGLLESAFGLPALDEAMRRRMALWIGRALWNAFPLASNGYRPRPLPAPRRNDPCPCGSGRKHKRCCAWLTGDLAGVTRDAADAIWLLMASRLPPAEVRVALSRGTLRPEIAAAAARHLLAEEGRPRRAAGLAGAVVAHCGLRDPRVVEALDVLWDACSDLGWQAKKARLLRQAVAGGCSAVQAVAHERLAAIAAEDGDYDAAWSHWHTARRLDPERTELALLEITLLVSQGRLEEAGERARFLRKALERQGEVPPQALAWLDAVAEDPGRMRLGVFDPDDPIHALAEAVAAGVQRPVPRYALERVEAAEQDGSGGEAPPAWAAGADEHVLVPPKRLERLERRWWKVFGADDPLGGLLDPSSERIWGGDAAGRWIGFLASHPEAFDSLDVLDDVAHALEEHPWAQEVGIPEGVYGPILERGVLILERAIGRAGDQAVLPWGWLENRPALQLLHRLAGHREAGGRREEARVLYRRLLELNPNDNHGVRAWIINDLLREGDDVGALALADRYPDDVLVETRFGRALALWRLGRREEARRALREAHEGCNRHVIGMLCARHRHRPRELDEGPGLILGGRGQAWLYRGEMADVWRATPDILDAAREIAGRPGTR